jgi:hypothetical protein
MLTLTLSLCVNPVGAKETDPDSSLADAPAMPWLVRAGFLSRALLLPIEQDGAPDLSYWPNHTNLLSFTAGYRDFVVGFSQSTGQSEPVETHGTSSGFDLRLSFPLEVVDRQLFLSGTVQDYRGFYLQSPQVDDTPLVREDISARHLELAASYFLDPSFDYSGYFVGLARQDGFEDSFFARVVGSSSTVSGHQALVPGDYADDYGASSAVSAVDSYAVHALAGYALHLSWAGLFTNAGLAFGLNGAFAIPEGGTEPSRLSAGLAMQFAFGLGFAREHWHAAMLVDGSAHEVRLRELGVSWLPIQANFVFGLRF